MKDHKIANMNQPIGSTIIFEIPAYPVLAGFHCIKTETEYYQATEKGLKMFEVCKDDRNYCAGDTVSLQEVVHDIPTGRKLELEITYVLRGGKYGLAENYCILQLKNKLPIG